MPLLTLTGGTSLSAHALSQTADHERDHEHQPKVTTWLKARRRRYRAAEWKKKSKHNTLSTAAAATGVAKNAARPDDAQQITITRRPIAAGPNADQEMVVATTTLVAAATNAMGAGRERERKARSVSASRNAFFS